MIFFACFRKSANSSKTTNTRVCLLSLFDQPDLRMHALVIKDEMKTEYYRALGRGRCADGDAERLLVFVKI